MALSSACHQISSARICTFKNKTANETAITEETVRDW